VRGEEQSRAEERKRETGKHRGRIKKGGWWKKQSIQGFTRQEEPDRRRKIKEEWKRKKTSLR